MSKAKNDLEQKVLKVIKRAHKPPSPSEVIERITGKPEIVRDVIISLVDRGKLQVTIDWKLRVLEGRGDAPA